MTVSILTLDGHTYSLDERVLPFSPVLQCLDPSQDMPLELTLPQIRHIHEFYLMFDFQQSLIDEMFLDIDRHDYTLPQALDHLSYLRDYHSSLGDTCLVSLAKVSVHYQFDHLSRLLFKCLGHGYVYQECHEQQQQLGVIKAEVGRVLEQYPGLFHKINQRISARFNQYSDFLLQDQNKIQQRLTEDQVYQAIFGDQLPLPPLLSPAQYRRAQL